MEVQHTYSDHNLKNRFTSELPLLPETLKNYGHTAKRTYIFLTFMLNFVNRKKKKSNVLYIKIQQ